nr:MAG TPA: hypothetical protein [Inoviridae sp.]
MVVITPHNITTGFSNRGDTPSPWLYALYVYLAA